MEPQMQKPDKSKLSIDQLAQLETYQTAQDQLQKLEDMATMLQTISTQLHDGKQAGGMDKLGALLVDIRESLSAMNAKEAPESPDYAAPVVAAVSKLEKALAAATKPTDPKPVVVPAPNVTVEPTPVDLSGIEKALKALPKAFEVAVKLIDIPEVPQTDWKPLLDVWAGISEQLLSIENATRAKPLPGSIKVSNLSDVAPVPGLIPVAFDRLTFSSADANGNYRTGTVIKDDFTVGTLTLAYDASSNLTDIRFT